MYEKNIFEPNVTSKNEAIVLFKSAKNASVNIFVTTSANRVYMYINRYNKKCVICNKLW